MKIIYMRGEGGIMWCFADAFCLLIVYGVVFGIEEKASVGSGEYVKLIFGFGARVCLIVGSAYILLHISRRELS